MKKLITHMGKNYDKTRVLGIDPSSTAIAFTLIEGGRPSYWGKLTFFRKAELTDKMRMMNAMIECILSVIGKPTLVVIEEMISVQNPNTTRILSYIAGALTYEFSLRGIDVDSVKPMVWKSYHGYKRVTKAMGLSKKEADRLRKSQTQDAIDRKYPWFNSADNDISDSCGIALWGSEISLKEI